MTRLLSIAHVYPHIKLKSSSQNIITSKMKSLEKWRGHEYPCLLSGETITRRIIVQVIFYPQAQIKRHFTNNNIVITNPIQEEYNTGLYTVTT